MPRISVIIPAYNSARYIVETIDSVLQQDWEDFEVIVVDDGSTDDTVDIVKRIGDERVAIHCQENARARVARQNGLQRASGDWIIFLDHDDRLTMGAFERFADGFTRHPDAVSVYGERVFIDERGDRFGAQTRRPGAARPQGDVLCEALADQFITTVGQVCIKGEALRKIGGFPQASGYGSDWALWCLLASVGTFVYLGPGPVLEYRRHRDSMGISIVAADKGATHIDDLTPSMSFVFEHPGIRARIDDRRLGRFRRKREANCHRFKGVVGLRAKAWPYARRHFLAAVRRDPVSATNLVGLALALFPVLRPFGRKYVG